MKPIEIVNSEFQRYVINNSEILNEQRFITKKFSSEIPIFFKIEAPKNIIYIESRCPKCGSISYAPDHFSLQKALCNKCKAEFLISKFDEEKFNEFKSDAYLKSESYFKTKFDIMIDNYQMCT